MLVISGVSHQRSLCARRAPRITGTRIEQHVLTASVALRHTRDAKRRASRSIAAAAAGTTAVNHGSFMKFFDTAARTRNTGNSQVYRPGTQPSAAKRTNFGPNFFFIIINGLRNSQPTNAGAGVAQARRVVCSAPLPTSYSAGRARGDDPP